MIKFNPQAFDPGARASRPHRLLLLKTFSASAAVLAIFATSFTPASSQQSTIYDQGAAAMAKDDLKSAIGFFDQAVTNDATDWKSYLKRGQCLYQLGDYRLAIPDFNQVLTKHPKNTDALLWRGNANAKLAQADAALKDYKALLIIDPTKVAVLSQRATFTSQRQQPLNKEETVGSAPAAPSALVAASPVTALHLRFELFAGNKDPNEALTQLNSAISIDPRDAQLFYKRAQAYIQLRKYDSALSDLGDAILNNPNNASYYLARAFVYHSQGNDILADEDISQAQFCDPGLPKTIDFQAPNSKHK